MSPEERLKTSRLDLRCTRMRTMPLGSMLDLCWPRRLQGKESLQSLKDLKAAARQVVEQQVVFTRAIDLGAKLRPMPQSTCHAGLRAEGCMHEN